MPRCAISWPAPEPAIETRELTASLATDDDLLDLYERAPFGHVSTDHRWSIVRVNATFADLVGHSPAELVGRPLTDLMSSGSRIYHETHYAPLLAMQGQVGEVAGELVGADGERVAVMLRSVLIDPASDGEQRVIRTGIVVAEDRRSYEAEIQAARRRAEASERRLSLLSRTVAALVPAADLQGIAEAVAATLGHPDNPLTGIWLADAPGELRLLRSGTGIREPERAAPTHAIVRAWREQRPVADMDHELIASPFGPGDRGGVVAIALAQVPTRLRESAGSSAAETPPEELGEEDADLLRAIGREVDQALERARLYEHKDWLLGVAAHDLRSPLTALIGNAQTLELLLADRLEERDRLLLERIANAGSRMAMLIDDVLEFSSIEAGTLAMSRQPTDLLLLIAEAIRDHRAAASAKDIRLRLTRDFEGGPILLDPVRMRQVVDNLVSNAVKYGDPGSTVRIEVSDRDDSVALVVADQGQGIAEDELPNVFVPFRRTSSQPTGNETSTGLGLSIAKSIVESHGGRIEVASRPGEGATFTVMLPRRDAEIDVG
ncbi:MAG: PAS domain-containing sensor histidine kinase [Nitriliruptorales bacterium]|nr:PAS domain-containing sensor histidine kinase [Nitriliruptorales bacterium]